MRRRRTILACALLGMIVLAGATLQGNPVFTGLRWVPDLTLPQAPVPTRLMRRNASATPASMPDNGTTPTTIDLSWLLWVLVLLAVAVAVLLAWRVWSRRPPHAAPALSDADVSDAEPGVTDEQQGQPDAPVMRRGFERALEILDEDRVPDDAIVAAWLGLQDAAELAGVRRMPAETPTEFTRRIVRRTPADDAAIGALLGLYLRVRFGENPATVTDVAVARRALQQLAIAWRADGAGSASTTPPPVRHP